MKKHSEKVNCSFEGCDRKVRRSKLCALHYGQKNRYNPFQIRKNSMPSPISKGKVALYGNRDGRRNQIIGYAYIDAEYETLLGHYHWCLSGKYACTPINGKTAYMHRLIMQPPDCRQIDHIDGDGLNNRRSNLRIVTQRQNMHNQKRISKSGHRNVYATRNGKWMVRVREKGKVKYYGTYSILEDASAKAEAVGKELDEQHKDARCDCSTCSLTDEVTVCYLGAIGR
jgi:hypothetical protein